MPVRGKRQPPPPRQEDEKVMRVGDADMLEDASIPGVHDARRSADSNAGASDIKAVLAERDGYLELARRERADFDNYRKRVERDIKQIKLESLGSFLRDFFGPLDDMDRVLAESAKSESFDSLLTGVRLMRENFWKALARAGVKKIDAKGKPFDPARHEAMTTLPSGDLPPNTVLEVYDSGYELDGFILRPARVVVSRPPDA
jgi:molecular chaperone GrpE